MPQNPAAALLCLEFAAERGSDKAQLTLGLLHAHGDGVPQNWTMAAEWLGKAANQGDATAQYQLGTLHARGKGVEQNMRKALELWEQAAAQGLEEATAVLEAYNNAMSQAAAPAPTPPDP